MVIEYSRPHRGNAQRLNPCLPVQLRAEWIIDSRQDARDPEPDLGDLRRLGGRVVAVCHRHEGVRAFDACLSQDIGADTDPLDIAPPQMFPQPPKCARIHVDD